MYLVKSNEFVQKEPTGVVGGADPLRKRRLDQLGKYTLLAFRKLGSAGMFMNFL